MTRSKLYLALQAVVCIALVVLLTSERMPDQTPHQRTRSGRIAASNPLFWLLIAAHLGMAFFNAK